jgi:DNA (cytosine-5)-methyltransferase 1
MEPMTRSIRFADLFAGLGGFHQAAVKLGCKCVFASEINPKLRELYQQNFGLFPEGDIRKIDPEKIPRHDLLCAGFPCQPFSKAGSQLGWKDRVRGTLFSDIVAIIELQRPEFVILENLAHFVNHDKGQTYIKVKVALQALGYEVDSKQLSPHQFGVPHIRQRMYMVARRNSLKSFRWPKPSHSTAELSVKDVLDTRPKDAVRISTRVRNCLTTWQEFLDLFPTFIKLPSFPIWSMEFGATYPYHRKNLRSFTLKELRTFRGAHGRKLSGTSRAEIEQLLPSYARGGGGVFPRWKQLFIRQNREFYAKHKDRIDAWLPKIMSFPPSLQKFEWNCQGETRDVWRYVIQFRASGVRVKRATTAPSLVAMTTSQVPIIAREQRYMTPRECARLQSMGDLNYLPSGVTAMEAFGNAVNVTVVELILGSLLERTHSPISVQQTGSIRRRVREGMEDIKAGRFTEYEGREGLKKLAEDVKARGRKLLAANSSGK